jgi:hypothetical protein
MVTEKTTSNFRKQTGAIKKATPTGAASIRDWFLLLSGIRPNNQQ